MAMASVSEACGRCHGQIVRDGDGSGHYDGAAAGAAMLVGFAGFFWHFLGGFS